MTAMSDQPSTAPPADTTATASADAAPLDIREAARTHAFDSYAAALLAPAAQRDDLMVLVAFFGEAARIPFLVSEPMLGEIRLQWWRDWLETRAVSGGRTGNPLADRLAETIDRHALDVGRLKRLLEARADDAYAGCVTEQDAFSAYLDATTGAEFALAGQILGIAPNSVSANPDLSAFMAAATRATGIVDVCRRLPWHAARGRWPLPVNTAAADAHMPPEQFDPDRDIFDADAATVRDESQLAARNDAHKAFQRARKLSAKVNRTAVHATLRTALVEPYLRALEAPGLVPLQNAVEILPITRMWRLWRAHRRRRF